MTVSALDVVHLMLAYGFHRLFAAVIITLGWSLVAFLVMQRLRPNRGWGLAFDFWLKVLTLSFALWAMSGISLWLQPSSAPHHAFELRDLILCAGLILPAGLLPLLLYGRHLLSRAGLLTLSGLMATLLSVVGVMSPGWAAALPESATTPLATSPWLVLARSAMTTGALLAGLSALRVVLGDRQPDVRYGLITGLALTAMLGPVTLGLLLGATPGQSAMVFTIKAITAAALLTAALGLLWLHRTWLPEPKHRRLPDILLAGFAALGLIGWLIFTIVDVAMRTGPLWASLQMSQWELSFNGLHPGDVATFATYAVLYAGLTGTYIVGLGLMARARAIEPQPARAELWRPAR